MISALLFAALISLSVRAEEGLHFDSVPAPIHQAWDSTIVFFTQPANKICTASLIDKKVIKKKKYLVFLSAGHCLVKNYPELFPSDEVQSDRAILQKTITQTFSDIHSDASKSDWKNHIAGPAFPFPLKPVWTYQHYGRDKAKVSWDVSIIAFETTGDISQLAPLEFSKDKTDVAAGAKHYTIGFPGTVLRPVEQQNVPIAEPTIVRKRWSTGIFLEGWSGSGFRRSTADGLPGVSGGPVLSSSGQLIGVFYGGHNTMPDGSMDYSYPGINFPKAEQALFWSPENMEEIVRGKISQFVRDTKKGDSLTRRRLRLAGS